MSELSKNRIKKSRTPKKDLGRLSGEKSAGSFLATRRQLAN
jgi:hypothetical protein